LWAAFRTQDRASPVNITFGDAVNADEVTVAQRVDLFATTLGLLLTSAGVLGLGLLARLAGGYMQARVGGSVTGFLPGDSIDTDTP
jgi:hypothetical protein